MVKGDNGIIMRLLSIGHWTGSSGVYYLLISSSSGAEQLNLSHTVNLTALYFTCTFFRFSVHFHSRTDNRLLTYKSNFIVSIFITRNEFTDVIMKCLVVLSNCIIFCLCTRISFGAFLCCRLLNPSMGHNWNINLSLISIPVYTG